MTEPNRPRSFYSHQTIWSGSIQFACGGSVAHGAHTQIERCQCEGVDSVSYPSDLVVGAYVAECFLRRDTSKNEVRVKHPGLAGDSAVHV